MRRVQKSSGASIDYIMASISRPRRSLYLDSLLCHRREVLEETLTSPASTTPSTTQTSSMSGLKNEDSPDHVNGAAGHEPPSAAPLGRERRSSFSSSTTGDSGYGSVLGNTFLEHKTIQHFESGDDYLLAMIEDLADWFSNIYDTDITVETLFNCLDSGVMLCRHAHEVHKAGEEYIKLNQRRDLPMKVGNKVLVIPQQPPNYRGNAQPGTFVARDNIANFIYWCRAFGIPDCLSFETEDLVLRKNVRSVVLCLLEIGRVGAKFGMEAPDLVIMEEEIDAEIEADAARARAEQGEDDDEYEMVEEEFDELEEEEEEGQESFSRHDIAEETILESSSESTTAISKSSCQDTRVENTNSSNSVDVTDSKPVRRLRKRMVRRPKIIRPPYQPPPLIPEPPNSIRRQRPRPKCDMRSLDEMVRDIIKECTCEETFPMKRLGEGKYQFGDNSTLIFVRILRYHVMVRVGGGWDTLNHFLEKYDPCRKCKVHSGSKPTACVYRPGGSYGSRDQSEEPKPLRASTPRQGLTPNHSASCLEELQQRQTVPNRNYKEGMMNVNRPENTDRVRNRTKSIDANAFRPSTNQTPRSSMPKSNRSSCEFHLDEKDASEPTETVKLRSSSSKLDQLPQEPVDRIGSLYLHNTVDDLRRCLDSLQTTLKQTDDDPNPKVVAPPEKVNPPIRKIIRQKPAVIPEASCPDSEALSSREMYMRMQRDFELMQMGGNTSSNRPDDDDNDDAVSVASSCSSTNSAATTGSRRFASRIPVPVRYNSPRSNPTTPEMTRRVSAVTPNLRKNIGTVNRRSSFDSGRIRPVVKTRRSSITAAGGGQNNRSGR